MPDLTRENNSDTSITLHDQRFASTWQLCLLQGVSNFLLTLGAEFDAIVNLDGYNETALTIRDNAESDTANS